jgi:hypothetical protein
MAWLAEQGMAGASAAMIAEETRQFARYAGGDCDALNPEKILDEGGKGMLLGIALAPVGSVIGKALGGVLSAFRGIFSDAAESVATASPVGLAVDLLKYAGNVQPKPGLTDVFIHSDANGFAVLHNGQWVDLTHRDVANFIASKGITGDIRLISCEAGQRELAQNLANKLGVSVEAATTKVGIYKYQFGDAMTLDGGVWKNFVPGTKP